MEQHLPVDYLVEKKDQIPQSVLKAIDVMMGQISPIFLVRLCDVANHPKTTVFHFLRHNLNL